jgi:hypothetical protein
MSDKHYMGNPLLKRANVSNEFTQEQLIELAKCGLDPVYFARNYIKIVNVDDGLVPFDMWPFQEKMLRTFHENRFSICKLPRQSGKSLHLDTLIPTPSGWTTMGDIEVGDHILSPSGKSVTVIKKTETMYNHDCYKIYFDNGEEIIADAGHLWEVNSSYWNVGEKVVTTEDIFNTYKNKKHNKRGKGVVGSYYIKITKPIETCIHQNLPIDPYLLGVWLGDGYSADSRVISHKDDFEYYKTKIQIDYLREDGNCIRFKCKDLQKSLKQHNLLKNKHIPQQYLRASYEARLELLRGLMDTDGSLKPNTRSFEFYQKNYDLILQVVELLSSMGIKSNIRVKKIKDSLYHTISFTTNEIPFNLPRKIKLINNSKPTRPQEKRHYIQKIEKVNSVPVACISVDSDDHLFLCGRTFIPTHNSTTSVSFLLHYAIFNEKVSIAILANKQSSAKDILSRLQVSFENLPDWMQPGVKSWNKTSLELDNGSKIITASTSASSVRGGSYNVIFLDEFAFVPNNIALNFMNSVYPTISSGKDTKVIICSTPQGLNYFYKMWDEAQKKLNDYVPLEINWNDVPGRDEKWKIKTIANLGGGEIGSRAFDQEFSCSFLGSSNTLISGATLQSLVYTTPIKTKKKLDIYEEPIENHQYMINVDVARGVDLDYSAFTVVDITNIPYKLVAKYRDNTIKPMMFPYIVRDVGMNYNQAYILCETNDVGNEVATTLHYDLEYPNLLTCYIKGRQGQILGQGTGGNRIEYGVKMTPNVKKIGSFNLKALLESGKFTLTDYDTINELSTFVQKSNTFKAEEGKNDDLVDCLVTFSWAATHEYFKEITDHDIRKKLFDESSENEETNILPIGFAPGLLESEEFVDNDNILWTPATPEELSNLWNYHY